MDFQVTGAVPLCTGRIITIYSLRTTRVAKKNGRNGRRWDIPADCVTSTSAWFASQMQKALKKAGETFENAETMTDIKNRTDGAGIGVEEVPNPFGKLQPRIEVSLIWEHLDEVEIYLMWAVNRIISSPRGIRKLRNESIFPLNTKIEKQREDFETLIALWQLGCYLVDKTFQDAVVKVLQTEIRYFKTNPDAFIRLLRGSVVTSLWAKSNEQSPIRTTIVDCIVTFADNERLKQFLNSKDHPPLFVAALQHKLDMSVSVVEELRLQCMRIMSPDRRMKRILISKDGFVRLGLNNEQEVLFLEEGWRYRLALDALDHPEKDALYFG